MDVIIAFDVVQGLGVKCDRAPMVVLELAEDSASSIPGAVSFYTEGGIVDGETEDRAVNSSGTE